MESFDRKEHWEKIYRTKAANEVSWYQQRPAVLDWIRDWNIPKDAKVFDIGGGDSLLPDYLLSEGFNAVTVLDISHAAIERAKNRLGERSNQISWVVSDIVDFNPSEKCDLWYDRAAFHFLVNDQDVQKYFDVARKAIKPGGRMVIGTFSVDGPKKCSGIDIRQYSEESLCSAMGAGFELINCIRTDHKTPFETVQNFLVCSFWRME
jgi:SAM-dependent methyltransferase